MKIQDETPEEKELFQHLRERYIKSIPAKLAELTSAWDLVRDENWTKEPMTALKRHVHRLAGSGSSYGLPEITKAAKKLENSLDLQLANVDKQSTAKTTAEDFRALLTVLRQLEQTNP